jgi:hypothetical protein
MDDDLKCALDFIEKGERPSMEAAARIVRYNDHFEGLLQMLDARMRGILKTLDENGDVFPVRTFEAWRYPKNERRFGK